MGKIVPVSERFLTKVKKTDTCWLWTAYCGPDGYGRITIDKRPRQAHVIAWEMAHGPVPKGLELDHLCRVHNCVWPKHLEPVTRLVNVNRGLAKGGTWNRGEKQGAHKLKEIEIPKIRSLWAEGLSCAKIALLFKVSSATIWSIVNYINWRHVG